MTFQTTNYPLHVLKLSILYISFTNQLPKSTVLLYRFPFAVIMSFSLTICFKRNYSRRNSVAVGDGESQTEIRGTITPRFISAYAKQCRLTQLPKLRSTTVTTLRPSAESESDVKQKENDCSRSHSLSVLYPRRDLNPHSQWPRDFKSLVSTDSTTRACINT
jgi:hypothetical protein